ncbi:MAG: hypothetical protein ACYTG7_24465, partial [Planctomycetota bacterium]
MKRFAVNLLTLFQCPALWLGHVLCSFVFLVLVLNPPKDPVAEDRRFVGYLLIIYWIGIVVSSMAKEIMTKPFAFGLPRQGATLRAFILVTGLMVSIVMAGLIMDLPGSTGAETAAAFCSA